MTDAAERYRDLFTVRAGRGPRVNFGMDGPRFNLAAGKPDPHSFPYAELTQAMADVMELDGGNAMTYGQLYGHDGLRDLVVDKYRRFEGLELTRDQVLIANGSLDAIGLIVQTFVDEGDAVICEAPTFMATVQFFRRVGAEVLGVEVDEHGMRTDQAAAHLETLRRSGRRCKLIYTLATFHNPAGPTLTEARRRELLQLAREHQVIVLEDDAYGELRFEGVAPPSLLALDEAGLVVRTGTLSKTLGAGFRLGWAAGPADLIPYLTGFNFAGGVSPLASRIATVYLREHFDEHVRHLVKVYRERRDVMLEELERGLGDTDATWSRPEGGFFIWLKLPTETDPERLAQLAAEAAVSYAPGPIFMPNGGGEQHIRLSYSFETADDIREGTRRLCAGMKGAMVPTTST